MNFFSGVHLEFQYWQYLPCTLLKKFKQSIRTVSLSSRHIWYSKGEIKRAFAAATIFTLKPFFEGLAQIRDKFGNSWEKCLHISYVGVNLNKIWLR